MLRKKKNGFDVEKFSISEITQYLTCPRAWHYLYQLKFRLKKSDSLFIGSALHSGLETFYKGGDPVKAYVRYIKQNVWQKPKGFNEEKYIKEGINIMTVYKTKGTYFNPLPDWIERREITQLRNPHTDEVIPIPFSFKVDLVHQDGSKLFLVDHKSSSSNSTKQLETNRIQAISYLTALRLILGKKIDGFIQNSIIKRKVPQIVPTLFRYSEDDIDYVFNIIKYVAVGFCGIILIRCIIGLLLK